MVAIVQHERLWLNKMPMYDILSNVVSHFVQNNKNAF